MSASHFDCKQFRVDQAGAAMKVTTDACLFGAWVASITGGMAGKGLDIGAGTGLLSLMIAQVSELEITGVEIDEGTATQCAHNFRHSPWQKRLHCRVGRVQDFGESRYDLIVCNPPFYAKSLRSNEEAHNLAWHEGGLTMHELAVAMHRLLLPAGRAFVMWPADREKAWIDTALEQGLYPQEVIYLSSQPGDKPHRFFWEMGFAPSGMPTMETLATYESGRVYSAAAKGLLQPYYLAM